MGPEAEDATQGQLTDATAAAGKGKAAAEEPSSNSRGEGGAELAARREALREFLHHADSTNDIFRLAALVVAKTLLGAQRQLDANPGAAGGSSSSSGSGGASTGREPSAEACWRALLAAWQPFAVGHKGLWWECTAAPPEATAGALLLTISGMKAPARSCLPLIRAHGRLRSVRDVTGRASIVSRVMLRGADVVSQ